MATTITGQLIGNEQQRTVSRLRVEAWDRELELGHVLGTAESDDRGEFAIPLADADVDVLRDRNLDVFFKVLDGEAVLAFSRSHALWNAREPDQRVLIPLHAAGGTGEAVRRVSGRVTTALGRAAADVIVEAWDHNLGGAILVAAGATDATGRYELLYGAVELAAKPRADLSVRVLDPRQERRELARSPVSYQVEPAIVIDVTVDDGALVRAPEYARLLDALAPLHGAVALTALDAAGVEYLAQRSGWDARLVAMAARAAQLEVETRIPAAHYYALLRAGLPGDHAAVHRLGDAAVRRILTLAAEREIIGREASFEETVTAYRAISLAQLGAQSPPSAVASLGAMLDLSLTAPLKSRFLAVFRDTGGDPAALWTALAADGFPPETIERLKLDGKLGKLTRQNAPMIARLHAAHTLRDTADLARAGLYQASAWLPLIGTDTPGRVSRDAYAAGLAAQVNLALPAAVTAELVRRGELPIDGPPRPDGSDGEVAAFLRSAPTPGALGRQPVKTWSNYAALSDTAKAGARLAERLFQLSPSNASMIALHGLGLGSAFDITRKSRDGFLQTYGGGLPSLDEGELIYAKAQSIHATTLNLATMYLSYRASPNVYALTGELQKQTPDYSGVPGAPTLEDLFQNMDYCACDHCRSVLSPAAYYVELLQMIDVAEVPAGTSNPQTVLFGRRPDLQHLLLSCENTNVVLPYIDLVNEVLEHYVVHGNLAAFAGHNMDEDSDTADLLADPEYVTDAAYDLTELEVFPHGLPFDMPLAALRLLMQAWDSTLPAALRHLGTAAAARRETLGLSPAELSILTDTAFRPLPAYFGEPDGATIAQLNAAVANGKVFARRTGVTYEEVVELLRTTFINPAEPLITLTDVSPEPVECDFATLELRFALAGGTTGPLDAFAYQRLHRFIRLWKKLGWDLELTDDVVIAFLGMPAGDLTPANLDAAMQTVVASIGNLVWLMQRQSISAKKLASWLPLWDPTIERALREEKLGALLRFGVTDLRNLIEISGIDPLAADMHADAPSLLRFLDAVAALKSARLKVVDLDYLLRHRDANGALVPDDAALLRDLAALRRALAAVDVELSPPAQNADLGFARARMALVYDATVVDWFIGLIGDGRTYDAPLATAEEALPAKLTAVEPRLGFDPFARRLTVTGILAEPTRAALAAAAATLELADVSEILTQPELDAYILAFQTAAQALTAAGAADLAELAAEYPELKTIYDAVAPIADPAARAAALVTAILPALRTQLQVIALRGALAAQLKLEPALVEALTSGAAVLHAHGNAALGVIEDFRALETVVALATDGAHAFHVEPAATGEHNLYVAAAAGTTVTLEIGGVVAIPATLVGSTGEVAAAAPIALTAGELTAAVITLAGLPAGERAELRWRTKAMAKSAVPVARLLADTRIAPARASLLRLQKAALLLRVLPLTARELRHLAALDPATAGFLDALDVDGSIGAAALNAQWARVAWLAWFHGIKAAEPDEDTWIRVLEDPALTTPNGALVLAGAAEWAEPDLAATLAHLGLVLGDLDELPTFRRVKDAVDFIVATQQPAADLTAWAVEAPDAALIATIKETLRARQDEASWRATLQSVNDALRNQRRDALVAYILHHAPPTAAIDTADKLYEHFLIDVEMDACMQTSRIRQALSTVQMFITRCLMSLEPTVSASVIRADHWAWMKRYRVWEANRKVFLYPENWLEPELRLEKSPFFRELESELLKADITDLLAEDAFLSYLKKLDEVARLDIMATYLEEAESGDPDDDILHVFGRTGGITAQYYYRRFEYGYWTAWEKVPLKIEGDILVPVMWRRQLYLFWLTAVPKPQGANPDQAPQDMGEEEWGKSAKLTVELTVSWGEYYRGKWTSPKSSELKAPIKIVDLAAYEPDKLVVAARTFRPEPDVSERLVFQVVYTGQPPALVRVTFTSKNAPPEIAYLWADDVLWDDVMLFYGKLLWEVRPNAVLDGNQLHMTDKQLAVRVEQPAGAATATVDETLFTKTAKLLDGYRVRPVPHPIENQWEAPMFYSDEHSVFFVSPDEHVDLTLEEDTFYIPELPPEVFELPPLFEKLDPAGPVTNPLAELVNPGYQQAIGSNAIFEFGGVAFDATGIATGGAQ